MFEETETGFLRRYVIYGLQFAGINSSVHNLFLTFSIDTYFIKSRCISFIIMKIINIISKKSSIQTWFGI